MAGFTLAPSRPIEPDANTVIADFQSQTAELLRSEPPFTARITLHVVAGLIVSLILMSAFLSVDRVVVGRGRVMSESPRISVQPLETAVMRAIEVREGQMVRQGQILARLDPTFSTADVSVLRRRLEALTAETERIMAEMADAEYLPGTTNESTDLQLRLFQTRKSEYKAAIDGFDGKIASAFAVVDRARKEFDFYSQRLALMGEVETMRQSLEKSKVGSRMSTIAASDQRLEIERNAAAQKGLVETTLAQLEITKSERSAYVERWKTDLATTLVDRRRQADEARELLAKADRRKELVELRAPQDAVVLQVGDISVGSVIESAKKVMTLVPLDGGLKVEVEISGRDQGFVKVGQEVELKLDAWPFAKHGAVKGTVRSISGDSFALKAEMGASGPSVYMATVEVKETGLRNVPADFRLVPGMPLSADIIVGDQTLLAYLLSRALPVLTEGLHEP